MDFSFSEEQRSILLSVERFLDQHLPPEEVRRRDNNGDPPYHLLPLLGDMGVLGLPFPKQYGGLGGNWLTMTLIQEKLGQKAAMLCSLANRVVGFGGMSLITYGSEEQKQELMPGIINGNLLFALALSEPNAGSDAAALRTSARRTKNNWIINGQKTWISDADAADYMIVACRTGAPDSGAKGVSMFLVPRNAPGITMTALSKVGNNCLPSWDVVFDDTQLELTALMGEENNGFKHLMATLHYARSSMAANVTGQAQAVVDLVIAHATEREQFNQQLSKFQVIQHRIVDMQTAVDLSRLFSYRLGWLIGENLPCRRESAQAKLIATETLLDVTDKGMQILASAGYSTENDMQRYWRDARLYTFGEGSNEIQRNIIAKELGL
jgi:alkylation response protein AidB-like acyl-CoA dehydrogenase